MVGVVGQVAAGYLNCIDDGLGFGQHPVLFEGDVDRDRLACAELRDE